MKKRLIILTLSVLALTLCLLISLRFGCPIRLITGIPCPACGTTRALLSFISGDINSAFSYHPLFPLAIASVMGLVIYFVLLFTGKMTKKAEKIFAIFALSILFIYLCVYVVRLFLYY